MGCFLTYCHTFPEMLNDGLRSGGKRHEGGWQEPEGSSTEGPECAVVGAPNQSDESMRSC